MNATLNDASTITKLEPYKVDAEHAAKLDLWLHTRGGIFVWKNADMGAYDCGKTVCTPAQTETGEPTGAPSWRYTNTPDRHILHVADVVVSLIETVETVPIKLKPRGWGMVITKKSQDQLDTKLWGMRAEHPGSDCWYNIDGETAVFRRETGVIPLQEFMIKTKTAHES